MRTSSGWNQLPARLSFTPKVFDSSCLARFFIWLDLNTIYVGASPDPQIAFRDVISFQNIGRESYTFLHHLVARYDTLADITVFLQGSVDGGKRPHMTMSVTIMRNRALEAARDGFTTFGTQHNYKIFKSWSGLDWKQDQDCVDWLAEQTGAFLHANCTPSQFWVEAFGYDPPAEIVFAEGALFAVHATTIHRRPLSFYRKMLHTFEELDHVNPEIGHFMERF